MTMLKLQNSNTSSLSQLVIGLGGIVIGLGVGFLTGVNPLMVSAMIFAVALLVSFFAKFEQAVVALLILRSSLDPLSSMQIPAAFAIGVDLLTLLVKALKQEFGADEVALRLFYSGDDVTKLPDLDGNISQLHVGDKSLKVFDKVLSKQQPVCGRLTKAQKTILFDEQAKQVESIVCLPLGHEPCAGILAIGSYDPNRFHSDMGTVYLTFLGDVLMRLLRQYCHQSDGQ